MPQFNHSHSRIDAYQRESIVGHFMQKTSINDISTKFELSVSTISYIISKWYKMQKTMSKKEFELWRISCKMETLIRFETRFTVHFIKEQIDKMSDIRKQIEQYNILIFKQHTK